MSAQAFVVFLRWSRSTTVQCLVLVHLPWIGFVVIGGRNVLSVDFAKAEVEPAVAADRHSEESVAKLGSAPVTQSDEVQTEEEANEPALSQPMMPPRSKSTSKKEALAKSDVDAWYEEVRTGEESCPPLPENHPSQQRSRGVDVEGIVGMDWHVSKKLHQKMKLILIMRRRMMMFLS